MLRKIVETKKEEVRQLHAETTLQQLLQRAEKQSVPRGFFQALTSSSRAISVIAEVKRASPSKGLIRADFDPSTIALAYAGAQVEAISVLTDRTYFQGDLAYLQNIHEAVEIPLLRKDFLIDESQVVEARAYGADCILLIAAILDGEQLRHLAQTADLLGMDVLVEIHNQTELDHVFRYIQPRLLGINNRDLRTFEVNLATTRKLAASIPSGVTVVSESGIAVPDDVAYVRDAGARAVLVGEHFMRQTDITRAVLDLVGERAGAL